jgi:hypothetical protein
VTGQPNAVDSAAIGFGRVCAHCAEAARGGKPRPKLGPSQHAAGGTGSDCSALEPGDLVQGVQEPMQTPIPYSGTSVSPPPHICFGVRV